MHPMHYIINCTMRMCVPWLVAMLVVSSLAQLEPPQGDILDDYDDLVYVERRAYSGKRQGPEPRYVCRPSRDDVVRLLLALHEAKENGNSGFISFCNLRRPASDVLTSLRFLGRKK